MKNIFYLTLITLFVSCDNNVVDFDASGYFEADEVIVSAEQNGKILDLNVAEGQTLQANQAVGQIDVEGQRLQKEQVLASKSSLQDKTVSTTDQVKVAEKQLSAQQAQLNHLLQEQSRTQNLVDADAAPRKNLDDINAQITQIRRQMAVTREQINVYKTQSETQNKSVLSEEEPLEKNAEIIQYQIDKGTVVNPIAGTVLTTYANEGELASMGKPLYKIANLDNIYLKAYVSGDQLPNLKLNQEVTVRIDHGEDGYKNYKGFVQWISSDAEFTPKTIQTKKERANLVYAIKVKVANDGYLKLGMYGEVIL
ncbi:HlyD family efflux transporter periplasmic adaptor subunit [Flavobacteriaceae bacterium Ap0902]|nr:HlyD family efflux transporter periplasmic adaptor subunit [Flavobacteriaceae bacterium Ap0902]